MDLKQQMTGTLGRIQIVFSSVSLFLRWNQPIIPCASRSTAIDVQILALCYSLLSLSLSLTRCVTMATVGLVPSRTCLNCGNFVRKMDPTKMAICV